MIRSFACKDTQALFSDRCPRRFQSFEHAAARKLQMLDSAKALLDLRSPPGNRLEALKGDRNGAWSIRINSQWRICFHWMEDAAWDVEIVDYH